MIRFAKAEEKNLWVKLNIDFMKFEIANSDFWNNVDESEHEELAKTFDEAIKNPQHITIFMIEHQGEIIGFANLMMIFSVWAQGKALIIDDPYIKSDYQGKGFGRQVMKELENYAREREYKRIQFQYEETNPGAKAFYEKLGYESEKMDFYVRYI